jgi:PAS domain S-box-containing protein
MSLSPRGEAPRPATAWPHRQRGAASATVGPVTHDPRAGAPELLELFRVLARAPMLVSREAFERVSRVVCELTGAHAVGLVLPDGPEHARLFALSRDVDASAPSFVSFGERFASLAEVRARTYGLGVAHRCDDTREGAELERLGALAGFLSYWDVPLRGDDGQVVGDVLLGFRSTGGARALPEALAWAIADALAGALPASLEALVLRRRARLVEEGADAFLAWDREGRVADVNRAAELLVGVERASLVGLEVSRLLEPRLLEPALEGLEARGTLSSWEPGDDVARREPSTQLSVGVRASRVFDDALVAGHAVVRDLREIVAAERRDRERLERIRELEHQKRTLLDNAPLVLFRLEIATRELAYLSRYAETLFGVSPEQALSAPGFLRSSHAEPRGALAFERAVDEALAGRAAAPYEARMVHATGAEVTARCVVYPLFGAQGDVVAVEGMLSDVSVEHVARKKLLAADRLSTLGTLSAAVAHELNNPAAFVLLGVDALDRMLHGPGVSIAPSVSSPLAELVAELRASVRRIVDIAGDLRLFASPAPASGQRAVIDVNRAVTSALTLTRGQLQERATLETELGDVPPVAMEDGRLTQVVVNLLVNAAQAIPRARGELEHRIRVETRAAGPSVEIVVSDTGVGISRENQRRLFTPFFTTKDSESGTGLGLSISRDIVERAGGTIAVESPPVVPAAERSGVLAGALGAAPPGELPGARFVIRLPAASAVEPLEHARPLRSSRGGARLAVLVVEDEPSLGEAVRSVLAEHHEVELCEGGARALELLEERAFDVVLCDLRMPHMSGDTLYKTAVARAPRLARRFVFMTGARFAPEAREFFEHVSCPVLEKPFSIHDALAAIERAHGESRPWALG